ncbi:MAG TPA: phosphohydrolase, partial [Candidatus Nitrosopelagicus sp.]|nr:phosphohydrolase [Candidatus Nitrosopelagicus sp.]
SGSNNRSFYDPNDPFSKNRVLNDNRWALDHFYEKLLTLEKKMNTKTGKILAKKRTKILENFLKELKTEI